MTSCPLCEHTQLMPFHQDKRRHYLECQQCHLVIVPPEFHLSAELEKAEYDKHQNDPCDLGYQGFLGRCVTPLLKRVSSEHQGLDFGCGPGPAISLMCQQAGVQVSNYDLYYANKPELLKRQYDFVTMTEVIEHVYQAHSLLTSLDSLLRPNGILAVMTKRVQDKQAFANWHYKNDMTHIVFYSIATFQWIAERFNWRLEVIDKDVVFFHKN